MQSIPLCEIATILAGRILANKLALFSIYSSVCVCY